MRFFFIISLTLLFACTTSGNKTSENNAQTQNSIPAENTDTTITLRIKGASQTFRIKKDLLRRIPKFQEFLDRWPEIPALYIDTVYTDLTGDGNDEQIVTRIMCNGIDCIIFGDIMKDGKIILSDTLKPNPDLAFMDWSEDSIYFKLKPYTIFYDAFLDKNMVQEPENGAISEDLIAFYTSPLYDVFEKQHHDTIKARVLVDSVKRELRQYKGKYVSTLAHWGGSLLFWNRFNKRFEELYTP